MTEKQVENCIRMTAKHRVIAFGHEDRLYNYCLAVYGTTPSDVDNDSYIDSTGGCGAGGPMPFDEFHKSMIDSIALSRVVLAEDSMLKLIRHCLGNETCWRNYFVTGPDTTDFPVLMQMVEAGLMEKTKYALSSDYMFRATKKGIAFAWGKGETNEPN